MVRGIVGVWSFVVVNGVKTLALCVFTPFEASLHWIFTHLPSCMRMALTSKLTKYLFLLSLLLSATAMQAMDVPTAEVVLVGDQAQAHVQNCAAAGAALPIAEVLGATLPDGPPPLQPNPGQPGPRNPHMHTVELSVTIARRGGHVVPGWLASFEAWMQERCVAGIGTLERGGKIHHLHIQGCVQMQWPTAFTKRDETIIANQIKAALGIRRGDGLNCTVQVKMFAPGQRWHAMLGYCTKDHGCAHYKMVRHNVSDDDIERGKGEWASAKLSYEDDRCVIGRANLFSSVYNWRCVQCIYLPCLSPG